MQIQERCACTNNPARDAVSLVDKYGILHQGRAAKFGYFQCAIRRKLDKSNIKVLKKSNSNSLSAAVKLHTASSTSSMKYMRSAGYIVPPSYQDYSTNDAADSIEEKRPAGFYHEDSISEQLIDSMRRRPARSLGMHRRIPLRDQRAPQPEQHLLPVKTIFLSKHLHKPLF